MKLYYCEAASIRYDPYDYIVANSEQEAEKLFKEKLDKEGIWYSGSVFASEIKTDEYEIKLVKKSCSK